MDVGNPIAVGRNSGDLASKVLCSVGRPFDSRLQRRQRISEFLRRCRYTSS